MLALCAAGPFSLRAGGDLVSRERFGDFVLDFEFRLSAGANSGVKYRARITRTLGVPHALGCEYQLLDDARHPDARRGRDGNRRLASLYDVWPASGASQLSRPVGDTGPEVNRLPFRGVKNWNHGRIHVESGWIGHYLNGHKVLSVELGSAAWDRAVAASKFARRVDFCAARPGHIVLQDHGDAVAFRSLRIRPLD